MKKDEKDYIVDELLGLNANDIDDIQNNNETSILEAQNKIINQMKKESMIDDDFNSTLLDPRNDSFVSIIKDNVNFCVNELKDIDQAMNKISNQKNSEMFFRKSENIKLLSQYMSKMANVNQKTLDLLILLLGASGKVSDDYETILSTIDELGELNHGEVEVLNYLVKIKKMVYEIRDNDTKLKQVIEDNALTKNIVSHADEAFKKEIQESERARKIIDSKCNRLQKRIKLNNLYIGLCLILIIVLAVFVGIKLYVH